MKNLFKSFVAVTAAAMAFVGCVKEQPLAPQNNEETQTIKLVLDNQPMNLTKTQMNQEGTDVIWSDPEKVNLYADTKYVHYSKVTSSVVNNKLEATLNVAKAPTEIDGFFGAAFNRNTEIKDSNSDVVSAFGIKLPAAQSITNKTFDPTADALVMETKNVTGADFTQPISGIVYHRLHAITKLSFKGLEKYATDKVVSVEFSTKDADLAGNFTYDFKKSQFVDNTTGTVKTGSIFTESASKSVVMSYSENTLLDANFAAWMVTAAQTLKANEVVTITITTDKHEIKGSFTLPADKVFTSTQLNTLTLNMSKATVTEFKGKTIVFDMTIAPTIPNPTTSSNSFTDETRFRYDETKSVVLRMGEGMNFWGKTGSENTGMNAGDQLVIEGKKILSVQFTWTSKAQSGKQLSMTTDGKGDVVVDANGGTWTAADKGKYRVVFTAGAGVQYFRLTQIMVEYDSTVDPKFTPEFGAITLNDFAANSTASQTATVKVFNNPSNAAITLGNLTKFTANLNGDQLTVKPNAVNATTSVVTEDLILTVGDVTKKVTLTQLAKGAAVVKEITLSKVSGDVYTDNSVIVNGVNYSGKTIKMGKSKKATQGVCSIAAADVLGNGTLEFDAALWDGDTSKLTFYITKAGQTTEVPFTLKKSTGLAGGGNSFTLLDYDAATMHFSLPLEGITADTKIELKNDTGNKKRVFIWNVTYTSAN